MFSVSGRKKSQVLSCYSVRRKKWKRNGYENVFVPFPGIRSRLASFDRLLVQDVTSYLNFGGKDEIMLQPFFM